MAGYKETPRQKMIAMMYLVLTALLALNVSREILSAFLIVNDSMEVTNEQFSAKVDEVYAKFKQQNELNENKVGPYWNKAQQAQQYSDEFIKYINLLKAQIISATEGITVEEADTIHLKYVKKPDNYPKKSHAGVVIDISAICSRWKCAPPPTSDTFSGSSPAPVK